MKEIRMLAAALAAVLLAGCNITNRMGSGDTPLSSYPTHVEFWNGGAKIAEYDNAIVSVASVHNARLVGADITWYYYEVSVNGSIVDTIVDSEALCIKYSGARR